MKKGISIRKTYIVNKTVEQSLAQLDAVISKSVSNSKFSTRGSLESIDPPEFLLMLKWAGYFTNLSGDVFSTKLHVNLLKLEERTQIDVKTWTNPIVFILISILFLNLGVTVVQDKHGDFLGSFLITFLVVFLILGVDRFVKNMLIAGFEEDFGVDKVG